MDLEVLRLVDLEGGALVAPQLLQLLSRELAAARVVERLSLSVDVAAHVHVATERQAFVRRHQAPEVVEREEVGRATRSDCCLNHEGLLFPVVVEERLHRVGCN